MTRTFAVSALALVVLAACNSSTGGGEATCSSPPAAPTSLTATAASSTRIDLSWAAVTAPANCTVSYRVYRSTTPGFTPDTSNLVASGLSVSTYADTGLFASTTYHYVVQAVDEAGAAGASASATT